MSPDVVIIRRLFIRATGTLRPNSEVHADVVEIQRRAAMISLEIELTKGHDLYGGRVELTALFGPIRASIKDERRRKMS
jgi:hypothetical protein